MELPARNAASDAEVIKCAEREQRIVVTKDADFVESFLVSGRRDRGRNPQCSWGLTGEKERSSEESRIIGRRASPGQYHPPCMNFGVSLTLPKLCAVLWLPFGYE